MVYNLTRLIHCLRGHRVMLDSDIARIYGVETRALNQAVKRHPERFPPDFMFELTRSEIRDISQTVTCSGLKHSKRVAAFTETGVAMLSSVLRSRKAIAANIAIMRAFVAARSLVSQNRELMRKLAALEARVSKHDTEIGALIDAIRESIPVPETERRRIGFRSDG